MERKCRAPDDARSHTEMRRQRRTVRIYRNGVVNAYEEEYDVEVVVEDWTYDFGRDRLMRYLRFEQGRLAELNEGGYGSRDPDAEP